MKMGALTDMLISPPVPAETCEAFHMSQFEIIGTPAMRDFKRYVMPFSASSLRRHSAAVALATMAKEASGFGASATVSRTTLSNVEGEWVVKRNKQGYCYGVRESD
jgi:hypothetical protein